MLCINICDVGVYICCQSNFSPKDACKRVIFCMYGKQQVYCMSNAVTFSEHRIVSSLLSHCCNMLMYQHRECNTRRVGFCCDRLLPHGHLRYMSEYGSITDRSATSMNDDDTDWFIGLLVMDHMLCNDSRTCIHLYWANWDSTTS